MAPVWPIAASISCPISSSKYGKCHWSGASKTPSSDANSDTITLLTRPPRIVCLLHTHDERRLLLQEPAPPTGWWSAARAHALDLKRAGTFRRLDLSRIVLCARAIPFPSGLVF